MKPSDTPPGDDGIIYVHGFTICETHWLSFKVPINKKGFTKKPYDKVRTKNKKMVA
jgi:hypothetical protein